MEIVGQIHFDGYSFNVYNSLDEPHFLADDIIKALDLKDKVTLLEMVESDEYTHCMSHFNLDNSPGPLIVATFITELGLYNILSQTDQEIGRKWRRIIHSNLVMMRRNNKLTIDGQFEEWDAMLDDLYIDPETGILMQSVTVRGGDVEQIPYKEELN